MFVILILNINLNFAVLKLLKLLVDCDVEGNPGPTTYNLLKVIQGYSHQGHPKFCETAGIQCACAYFRYVGPQSSVLQCGLYMIWTIF